MRMMTTTITMTFPVFSPGERVRPHPELSKLTPGTYLVESYLPPLCPGDRPTVYIHGDLHGHYAEEFVSVDDEECETVDRGAQMRAMEEVTRDSMMAAAFGRTRRKVARDDRPG